jgi:hypothetical protein
LIAKCQEKKIPNSKEIPFEIVAMETMPSAPGRWGVPVSSAENQTATETAAPQPESEDSADAVAPVFGFFVIGICFGFRY